MSVVTGSGSDWISRLQRGQLSRWDRPLPQAVLTWLQSTNGLIPALPLGVLTLLSTLTACVRKRRV